MCPYWHLTTTVFLLEIYSYEYGNSITIHAGESCCRCLYPIILIYLSIRRIICSRDGSFFLSQKKKRGWKIKEKLPKYRIYVLICPYNVLFFFALVLMVGVGIINRRIYEYIFTIHRSFECFYHLFEWLGLADLMNNARLRLLQSFPICALWEYHIFTLNSRYAAIIQPRYRVYLFNAVEHDCVGRKYRKYGRNCV